MSHSTRPLALLSLFGLAACGSTGAKLCERLDECNALAAGVSVTQCTENFDKALDELTASVRNDCERDLSDALRNASCEAFLLDFATSCPTVGASGSDTGL